MTSTAMRFVIFAVKKKRFTCLNPIAMSIAEIADTKEFLPLNTQMLTAIIIAISADGS